MMSRTIPGLHHVTAISGPPQANVDAGRHVAFRAESDEVQREWQERVAAFGLDVTPVIDRQYFNAIYFREPGGVLFEIATDPPGFATDEDEAELGTHLMLPPQHERRLLRSKPMSSACRPGLASSTEWSSS